MRALLQRVTAGAVTIEGEQKGKIGPGLVVLVGVGKGDTIAEAIWLAQKTAKLRIFPDESGKLNLSLADTKGEALVVSQFTLYADCSRGLRPGFDQAAPPDLANHLYEEYVNALRREGISVQTGRFQAYMAVDIANDGPVTILLERNPKD